MTLRPSLRTSAAFPRQARRGAVSIIFATAVIPLAMSVGLAVDYGFYIQALAQTTMAADAAVIHAVRVAVTSFNGGATSDSAGLTGGTAGIQWFQAQLGSLVTGSVSNVVVGASAVPMVNYTQATGTFNATISYQLKVPTHFGGLFNVPFWTTSQVASSAVTANAFVEVVMMVDTSASMSIGTTADDMLKIEELSVCMPSAIATYYLSTGAQSDVFRYIYTPSTVSYAPGTLKAPTTTPTPASTGACDPLYANLADADQRLCKPTSTLIKQNFQFGATDVNPLGYCPPGSGSPDVSAPPKTDPTYKDPKTNISPVANLPVPTCALSCHDGSGLNDLEGLVQRVNTAMPGYISIRLNVVVAAAADVVQTLITKEQKLGLPNQFSVGIREINSTTGSQDYPNTGAVFTEAGTDLKAALTVANGIQPTNNSTDIDDQLKYFAGAAKPSGTGGTPATPRKNLFLVTDGLQDSLRSNMPAGPRWTALNPANCTTLKTMGFNIFVLYTPYYPLPHYQYLNNIKQLSEPLANSPITTALSACATNPKQFLVASSKTDIDNAMQQMLNLALNQPATITQ